MADRAQLEEAIAAAAAHLAPADIALLLAERAAPEPVKVAITGHEAREQGGPVLPALSATREDDGRTKLSFWTFSDRNVYAWWVDYGPGRPAEWRISAPEPIAR